MSQAESFSTLRQSFGHLDGLELLTALRDRFPGRLAAISSFGAEAAVLLDLIAQIDKALPVFFVDSKEMFDETLTYRHELTQRLGLTDIRVVSPSVEARVEAEELWRSNPDRCCQLRKVLPLQHAVQGFDVLIDGRKRFHGGGREAVETLELGEGGVIKVSPLARWDAKQMAAAFAERKLPFHPLMAQGYRSIGCWPCSRPTGPDEPVRSGRWAGLAKTECGIHRNANAATL